MKILALFGIFALINIVGFISFGIAGLFVSFIVLSFVFLGVWTYKDAKSRGVSPRLWTAIVLLVPNFVGLIIYFLVVRKEEVAKCNVCGSVVQKTSKYCMNCGVELKENIEYSNRSEKSIRGLMIGFIIYFFAIIIIFISSAIMMSEGILRDDFKFNGNISIGLFTSYKENKWNMSYVSSTQEFTRKIEIKDNSPKTLYIESKCGKGKLSLRLVQGEIERTINLSPKNDRYEFDLSIFKDGEVKLYLIGNNAKNVKFKSYWE